MPLIKRWKRVPGWPAYEVSNYGEVRSYWTRKVALGRRGGMVISAEPKLLKRHIANGRLVVTFGGGASRTQKTFGVAYLVLWIFWRPPRKGEIARHYHDPDPWNCRIDNLRWGTHSDNQSDYVRHHGKHFNADPSPERRAKMSKARRRWWAQHEDYKDVWQEAMQESYLRKHPPGF